MKFNVELTVRDRGALLSVNESNYDRVQDAKARACRVAVAWAQRYGMPIVTATGAGIFVISDHKGISVAQTRVTGERA